MTKEISLTGTVDWLHGLDYLSSKEDNPQVKIFFDNSVHREAQTLEYNATKNGTDLAIKGLLHPNATTIPANLRVGVAGYAWRCNQLGAPCLQDIGTNHIVVADLLMEIKRDGVAVRDIPLIMHTVQQQLSPKVTMRLKITGVDTAGLQFAIPKVAANIAVQQIGAAVNQYVQAQLNVEVNMTDTIPGTERMRVPVDMSEISMESTDGHNPLPAVAFVMGEIPETNAAFWHNAFHTSMARDKLVTSDWDRLNVKGKARTTAQMIVQLVQSYDYVSDTVDTNVRTDSSGYQPNKVLMIEKFSGDATNIHDLDCEDGAAANQKLTHAFIAADLSTIKGPDKARLEEAQQIAKQYVVSINLAAVKGAAVGDKAAHKGAHMTAHFIPVHLIRSWLRTGSRTGRKLSSTLPFEPPSAISSELPFMIGEGTGMYESLGYEDPYINAKSYVYQMQSLAPFRKPIEHREGETSEFFIGALTGMTDYFIRRGHPRGAFWYVTKQPDGRVTRGAYYSDIMNHPEKVGIIMQDRIEPAMMEYMKDAIAIDVPLEPLKLTRKHPKADKNTHLQFVVDQINAMNRPAGTKNYEVPVYVRDHQINRIGAQNIVAEAQRLDRVTGARYYEERYTDTDHGYCLMFNVNLDPSK